MEDIWRMSLAKEVHSLFHLKAELGTLSQLRVFQQFKLDIRFKPTFQFSLVGLWIFCFQAWEIDRFIIEGKTDDFGVGFFTSFFGLNRTDSDSKDNEPLEKEDWRSASSLLVVHRSPPPCSCGHALGHLPAHDVASLSCPGHAKIIRISTHVHWVDPCRCGTRRPSNYSRRAMPPPPLANSLG